MTALYDQRVATLRTQVQALTLLLTQLLQQRATGGAMAQGGTCSAMTMMGPGAENTGVSQLQTFLARNASVYPEGKITGYYGSLTTAAVQRFQAKNSIISSGDPASTGYGRVGPKTLAAIQAQCGASSDDVGGFIQVSPVSGPAPLQVNVQATVNTTGSCVAAIYTINYGDGSSTQQITVPAGTCQSLQQTYTHTYSNTGTYSVTLAAGPHSSSATVVVQ